MPVNPRGKKPSRRTLSAGRSDPSWGSLAAQMLELEGREGWRPTAGSFTDWVQQLGKKIDRTPASLWRYLSAGRYYQQLSSKLMAQGLRCPLLSELDDDISPEALELLEKISRVAPRNALHQLERRLIRGELTRQTLRQFWETYRPVLEGKTARGRDVSAPKYNARDPQQAMSMLEAECVMSLRRARAKWAGHANAHRYRLFTHVSLPWASGRRSEADVIAIIQGEPDGPLEVHGLEVSSVHTIPAKEILRVLSEHVDFTWLVVPEPIPASIAASVSESVGILVARGGKIDVMRKAKAVRRELSPSDQLVRQLLSRYLAP